jgi:hypothetical protein
MLAGLHHNGTEVGYMALLPADNLFIKLRCARVPEDIAHILDAELL